MHLVRYRSRFFCHQLFCKCSFQEKSRAGFYSTCYALKLWSGIAFITLLQKVNWHPFKLFVTLQRCSKCHRILSLLMKNVFVGLCFAGLHAICNTTGVSRTSSIPQSFAPPTPHKGWEGRESSWLPDNPSSGPAGTLMPLLLK